MFKFQEQKKKGKHYTTHTVADTLRKVLHLHKVPVLWESIFHSFSPIIFLIVFTMFEFLFISYEIFSTAQAPILQDFHFAFGLFNWGFCFIIRDLDTEKEWGEILTRSGSLKTFKIKQTTLVYTRLFRCTNLSECPSIFQWLGFLACPAVTVYAAGGRLNIQIIHHTMWWPELESMHSSLNL